MINQEIKMTDENEFLKELILRKYTGEYLSIAYGRFNTPEGYFNIGKRSDGKYAFFINKNGMNSCYVLDNLQDDDKIKECLAFAGVFSISKPEKKIDSLFDFLD